MSLRFQRLLTYGPVVCYEDESTWTPQVKELYARLEAGDCSALAPLLEEDITFISNQHAVNALILLKFDPQRDRDEARAELRRIAGTIERRIVDAYNAFVEMESTVSISFPAFFQASIPPFR